MTTTIRSEQAAALGGVAPCQPAKPIPPNANVAVADTPIVKSVIVLDPEKEAWIGVELRDTDRKPVANAAFVVTPPNHDPVKGNLDQLGRARIEGVDPGQCTIAFPQLHRREFV